MCIAVGLNIGSFVASSAETRLFDTFQIGPVNESLQSDPSAVGAQPLSLYSVVERAIHEHPGVQDARTALDAAERELAGREAAFTPRLSVETTPVNVRMQRGTLTHRPSLRLSASQNISNGLSTTANVNVSLEDTSLDVPTWTVGLSYPLFKSSNLNSDNLSLRQSQINVESAQRALVQAEAEAVVDAIKLYHATIIAFSSYAQQLATLDEVQKNAETTMKNVELGILSEIDRIEAETELRRQQLARTQAERTYDEQMQSLLDAIGLSRTEKSYRLDTWPTLPHPSVLVVPSEWIEKAKEFDPSLWQRDISVETATMQLQAEIEKNKIDASLGANVGKGEDDNIYNWNVQVRFSYPLLDGGAQQRSLIDQQENVFAAERAYELEQASFEKRMHQLFHTLHDADEEAKISQLIVEKAKMELDMAKSAYERGLNTELDVNRAARALERAYNEHQAAVVDVYVALWRLDIATGSMPDLTMFNLFLSTDF